MVRRSLRWAPLLSTVVALVPALLSCSNWGDSLTPKRPVQREPNAALDQPPPLHTGGLGVLSVDAETGRQGPDDSRSHGDATAEAIATGVGILAIGTAAASTAIACSQPYSSAECLRGPGPGDESPSPAEPSDDGPILPLATPP